MVVVPDQEQGDILDKVIDRISILGTLSLLVAICAVGVGIFGAPDDFSLHICSLVLGAGRGGVPGCATVAGSFFVLLAPPGRVNQVKNGFLCCSIAGKRKKNDEAECYIR